MISTLSERLKEAMAGPPKVTGVALAKACNVSAPSVSDWLSGKSKSIDGGNLIDAAEFLCVRPKWLIKGVGSMRYDEPHAPRLLADDSPTYLPAKPEHDAWTLEAIGILKRLDEPHRHAAVTMLRTFAAQISPPGFGQALPMAGKIERASNGI